MKRYFLYLGLAMLLAATGCKKTDDGCPIVETTAPASEVNELRQYILDRNIPADEDYRGFFYQIQDPGDSEHPTACSNVTVSYVGKLASGAIFDQANNISLNLSSLIKGWQEGLPLIGKGGRIILYLPPTLGYGAEGSSTIPAGSILVFTIDLLYIN